MATDVKTPDVRAKLRSVVSSSFDVDLMTDDVRSESKRGKKQLAEWTRYAKHDVQSRGPLYNGIAEQWARVLNLTDVRVEKSAAAYRAALDAFNAAAGGKPKGEAYEKMQRLKEIYDLNINHRKDCRDRSNTALSVDKLALRVKSHLLELAAKAAAPASASEASTASGGGGGGGGSGAPAGSANERKATKSESDSEVDEKEAKVRYFKRRDAEAERMDADTTAVHDARRMLEFSTDAGACAERAVYSARRFIASVALQILEHCGSHTLPVVEIQIPEHGKVLSVPANGAAPYALSYADLKQHRTLNAKYWRPLARSMFEPGAVPVTDGEGRVIPDTVIADEYSKLLMAVHSAYVIDDENKRRVEAAAAADPSEERTYFDVGHDIHVTRVRIALFEACPEFVLCPVTQPLIPGSCAGHISEIVVGYAIVNKRFDPAAHHWPVAGSDPSELIAAERKDLIALYHERSQMPGYKSKHHDPERVIEKVARGAAKEKAALIEAVRVSHGPNLPFYEVLFDSQSNRDAIISDIIRQRRLASRATNAVSQQLVTGVMIADQRIGLVGAVDEKTAEASLQAAYGGSIVETLTKAKICLQNMCDAKFVPAHAYVNLFAAELAALRLAIPKSVLAVVLPFTAIVPIPHLRRSAIRNRSLDLPAIAADVLFERIADRQDRAANKRDGGDENADRDVGDDIEDADGDTSMKAAVVHSDQGQVRLMRKVWADQDERRPQHYGFLQSLLTKKRKFDAVGADES